MLIKRIYTKARSLILKNHLKDIKVLILFSALTGIVEIFAITAFLPFLEFVVSGKDSLLTKKLLDFETIQNLSHNYKVCFLALICVFLILFSNLSKIFMLLKIGKFMAKLEAYLSSKILSSIMSKPHSWFEGRNLTEIAKYPLSESSHLVAVCFQPLLNYTTSIIITSMLIITALIVEPFVVITVFLFLGSILIAYFKCTASYVSRNADMRGQMNTKRYVYINDILNSIREIKLYKADNFFKNRYHETANAFTKAQVMAQLIGNLPRFILEALLLTLSIFLIVAVTIAKGGINDVIPQIGFFCIFLLRVLPHIQNIYNSKNQFNYGLPVLNEFIDIVDSSSEFNLSSCSTKNDTQQIRIKNLKYFSKDARKLILKINSLKISSGEKIAVIGHSGSGKSTLMKLLCGFLKESDSIKFTNSDLHVISNCTHQDNVSYVPQKIECNTQSVRESITLGDELIKDDDIMKIIKILKLDSVINDKSVLDEMLVGANLNFSGGELQRLNIARALCRNRSWLIFDESCSALDPVIEKNILNNIFKIKTQCTIVMTTHRFENLHLFDRVLQMKNGEIIEINNLNRLKNSEIIKQGNSKIQSKFISIEE